MPWHFGMEEGLKKEKVLLIVCIPILCFLGIVMYQERYMGYEIYLARNEKVLNNDGAECDIPGHVYNQVSEHFLIDAEVLTGKDFDPQNVHYGKAYALYPDHSVVKGTLGRRIDVKRKRNKYSRLREYNWLTDTELLLVNANMIYYDNFNITDSVMAATWFCDSYTNNQELERVWSESLTDFSGGEAQNLAEHIREELGYETYVCDEVHTVSLEMLRKQQHSLEDMGYDFSEFANEDGDVFSKEQEGYFLYYHAYVNGLCIAEPDYYSVSEMGNLAGEPTFYITKEGVRYCKLGNNYRFKLREETVPLLNFNEVCNSICAEYESLDRGMLVMDRIWLMELPVQIDRDVYELIPVWCCYATDEMDVRQVLVVNAVTGETMDNWD